MMKLLSIESVQRTAHIMGEASAASAALAEYDRRRSLDEEVYFFSTGTSIIVGPMPADNQS